MLCAFKAKPVLLQLRRGRLARNAPELTRRVFSTLYSSSARTTVQTRRVGRAGCCDADAVSSPSLVHESQRKIKKQLRRIDEWSEGNRTGDSVSGQVRIGAVGGSLMLAQSTGN